MADDAARIAQLEAEVTTLRRREAALVAERAEALEHQAVTAEILGVITSAPTDLPRVPVPPSTRMARGARVREGDRARQGGPLAVSARGAGRV